MHTHTHTQAITIAQASGKREQIKFQQQGNNLPPNPKHTHQNKYPGLLLFFSLEVLQLWPPGVNYLVQLLRVILGMGDGDRFWAQQKWNSLLQQTGGGEGEFHKWKSFGKSKAAFHFHVGLVLIIPSLLQTQVLQARGREDRIKSTGHQQRNHFLLNSLI